MSAPTEHEHHVVGPKTYVLILSALLVLTATTTGAAFINMGVFSPIVALGIACLKAVLVILFFMHIRYSSRVMMLTVGAGFFTFLVLITMTLVRLHQPFLGSLVSELSGRSLQGNSGKNSTPPLARPVGRPQTSATPVKSV